MPFETVFLIRANSAFLREDPRKEHSMPTSRLNGVNIHWEVAGDGGDPMVLVHGSWGDHRNWASVVPTLSRSFRVLTYDRRGHSRSERPEGQGSVRDDAADLGLLLEELRLEPAHIVGTSFGASIVLRLAGIRSDLFRSMIVHEPPLFGLLEKGNETLAVAQQRVKEVVAVLKDGKSAEGARQFVDTIAFGPGAWDSLPEQLKETFIFNASTWLDEMLDQDALELDLDELRNFSAPALLTMGDQSPPHFPLVVEPIAKALPHAARRTFVGAGHTPHLSHPEEWVTTVTEFARNARN
jgi:pimeloyl-ACP methyl ester carboxylesterase